MRILLFPLLVACTIFIFSCEKAAACDKPISYYLVQNTIHLETPNIVIAPYSNTDEESCG